MRFLLIGAVTGLVFLVEIRHKSPESFFSDSIRPQWALLVRVVVFCRRPKVAKKLYVGNLPYDTTDSELRAMFEEFGVVDSAQVIMDRDSGRSKGFAFVEMSNGQEAQNAINALNGKDIKGRPLTVNEARPREDRGGRSGGGRGGRGGYGGGNRY
jgi:hypothetical protein